MDPETLARLTRRLWWGFMDEPLHGLHIRLSLTANANLKRLTGAIGVTDVAFIQAWLLKQARATASNQGVVAEARKIDKARAARPGKRNRNPKD